jgi:carboxyl-terminal processing protease
MKSMKHINKYKYVFVLLVVAFGIFGVSTNNTGDNGRYFEITKNLEIFTNLYKELNTYYVDELDPEKLMKTGMNAMLSSLDPYTVYIPEEEVAKFQTQLTGKYGGIGAVVRSANGKVVIIQPYPGSPAEQAGLKSGDVITSIDGQKTVGFTSGNPSERLKGNPGSEAVLTIKRYGENKERTVRVVRGEINLPNVPYSKLLDNGVAYIALETFTEKAGQNVANALKALRGQGVVNSIILDLRGNGGGLLNEAVNLTNVFVEKGLPVVETKGKLKDWDRVFKTLNVPVETELPLVVLIDENSASASEIVAGAIQDLDRGIVLGRKSFGKGLVQNTRDIGYNSKVKLTTAKYYIPSGRCIQAIDYKDGKPVVIADSLRQAYKTKAGRTVFNGGGIVPDVVVDVPATAPVLEALHRENLFFEYSLFYRQNNPAIPADGSFRLGQAGFDDFVKFLKDKTYSYETSSDVALKDLEAQAKEEGYYERVKADLDALRSRFATDKTQDIYKYQSYITKVLEREIVTRYHSHRGAFEQMLNNDDDIKSAVDLLQQKARYNSLLGR